jgi:rare lipoprotein A
MSTRILAAALLAITLVIPACAVDSGDLADEEMASTDNALTGSIRKGSTYKTTARLNLREEGSKSADIILTMPNGATVTMLGTAPQNGYYEVSYNNTEGLATPGSPTPDGRMDPAVTGWAHGAYLKATGAAPADTGNDDDNGIITPPQGSGSGGTVVSTGSCKASFYASGQKTANGERFVPDGITAAHKTLPFNTKVRVTNEANGKSVVVRINDRGPFVAGRCLDLSRGAFVQIASVSAGVASVKYEVLK